MSGDSFAPHWRIHWCEMACAYFEPKTPLPWQAWPGKYRPPLGRPYRGVCRAVSAEVFEPDGDLLVTGCNLGYARGCCNRLPDEAPDAARFSLVSSSRIRWSLERDHFPEANGTVTRGEPTGKGDVLDIQVEAYFRACDDGDDPLA